ncbi:uncharacterized protein K460DRAFT_290114 [Cucurbitaria berberidis CBS 394.84]|uniref:Aminoglycoside phosphotransferase domain-containing protein n=1 Tax=Cucurbitaria berberidis CBS 394.84 TaxID=1168544 RepID=A0A9P4L5Y5_9PLEO|nr:uncharacterized protein K460DRAFT_290114 [Cucurbitaria berberidis CBS 394.84]KAF1842749.1 hypothetical protein K460DRAFT_290114 [Cucurbitaria berberidis CBS 394.84]
MCALKLVPPEGLYKQSPWSSEASLSTITAVENTYSTLSPLTHAAKERELRNPLDIVWAKTDELDDNGQEPFSTFKYKINQLVVELFPSLEASAQLMIEEVGSGAFNRVIGVSILPSKKHRDSALSFAYSFYKLLRTSTPQDYVVRLPLDGRDQLSGLISDMTRDVAILQVVSSRLTIPVPKVISYELNENNALQRPYVLQNRLRGQSLRILMRTLNTQQMVSAVEQITKIIEKIAAVTAPAAGFISIQNLEFPSASHIHIRQYPVPTDQLAARFPGFNQVDEQLASPQTPFEYLVDHCQRWHRYEESIDHHENKALWTQLVAIGRSLSRRGWLGDRFHLVHDDLYPRNILAIVTSPTTVEVTGIVDWDMSFFAPKFVAFRPPYWAWMGSHSSERDEDNAIEEPEYEEGILLKNTFKLVASEEFVGFALSPEGVLARKLFYILEGGMLTKGRRILATELVRQWDYLYPTDKLCQFNAV